MLCLHMLDHGGLGRGIVGGTVVAREDANVVFHQLIGNVSIESPIEFFNV